MKRVDGVYWVNYYGVWEPAKFTNDGGSGCWRMYGGFGSYGSNTESYNDADFLDIDETPIRRKYPMWATWAMIAVSALLIAVSLYMTHKCNNG